MYWLKFFFVTQHLFEEGKQSFKQFNCIECDSKAKTKSSRCCRTFRIRVGGFLVQRNICSDS